MRSALVLAAFAGALSTITQGGADTTFVLHYVQKPIGFEKDTVTRTATGQSLVSDFDFTDRGARVHLDTTLETAPDFTLRRFRSVGKTYRFVNVDSEVTTVSSKRVSVKERGVERPAIDFEGPHFASDGYAPFGAQAWLLAYWLRHGRPHSLLTIPGEPYPVIIEERGRDTFNIGNRSIALRQFVVDGIVWGRETLWLDSQGTLAAGITRAGGLSFEAVREDLEPALTQFVERHTAARIADLAAVTASVPPLRAGSYALTGATVIGTADGGPIRDAVVVVRDGRIDDVGPRSAVRIPAGVPNLDVTGKTIAPGLWDMHTHFTQVEWGPVYLAAGVTTVRDMGNEFEFITAVRDAVNNGRALGPRLLLAGLVDGGGPNAFGVISATTAEEAHDIVARYHGASFEQMKIYSLITPPVVAAIAREAHAAGMTVTGHVPNGMTIVEAAEAGMDQVAHLAIRGEAGSEEVARTIAALKSRGTVVDPTQSWNELLGRAAGTDVTTFQPGFTKIPVPLQRVFESAAVVGIDAGTARERLERGLRVVKALHDAGVPVVTGTDEGIPGHSVHREIELYVEAGMTPLAALQAATIVPARAMKLDAELGTVERGKRADLVVLDANPLEAVANIRRVRWTIRGGAMYDAVSLWKSVRFVP